MLCRKQFLTDFIAIRKSMFSKAESQLESAEILRTGHYHKERGVIVCDLLKRGSILRHTFQDLVGRDTGNKLLETNIRMPLQSSRDHLSVDSDETVWQGKFGSLGRKMNILYDYHRLEDQDLVELMKLHQELD